MDENGQMLVSPEAIEWVGLVVAVLIPILVDLATKRLSDPAVKAVTLAALSAVSGFLVELIAQAGDFDLQRAVLNTVAVFLVATASFFGFWHPVGVSGTNGRIQQRVPGGIGTERENPLPT